MDRYDAIYARQSIDKADSISIESQIELCKYETRGGAFKVFFDKGYSGKNTDRPQLARMMELISKGEIKRVICYKLDRISRSIIDFTSMMEEFEKKKVEFVSCTEKFDTSTPMGRAMLNICIVFAQLERETIQQRVTDIYASRSRRGFYMGGRVPLGYQLEPFFIDGKKTSRYTIVEEEAKIIEKMYQLYIKPQASCMDVVKYFNQNGIPNPHAKNGIWSRSRISEIIKNPIYVKADKKLYDYLVSQQAIIHNLPDDFCGEKGLYLYSQKGDDKNPRTLLGKHIVIAPHDGIVSSDLWLLAREKCMKNFQFPRTQVGVNSWLCGKAKCKKCGYALVIRYSSNNKRYFFCSHKIQTAACDGLGRILADDLEKKVLFKISQHIKKLCLTEEDSLFNTFSNWETLSVQEKKELVNELILSVHIKSVNEIDIMWKEQ